jgi:hypothetical protein
MKRSLGDFSNNRMTQFGNICNIHGTNTEKDHDDVLKEKLLVFIIFFFWIYRMQKMKYASSWKNYKSPGAFSEPSYENVMILPHEENGMHNLTIDL